MRISTLLIGILLVASIMTGVSNLINNLNDNYNTSINESELDSFNKVEVITNLTDDTKQQVEDISDNPNFVDKLSSFFNAGIIAFKTTFASFDIVGSMINEGLVKIGLGGYSGIIKAMLYVAFFIAIAVGAIIKWRT